VRLEIAIVKLVNVFACPMSKDVNAMLVKPIIGKPHLAKDARDAIAIPWDLCKCSATNSPENVHANRNVEVVVAPNVKTIIGEIRPEMNANHVNVIPVAPLIFNVIVRQASANARRA